MQKAVFVHAHNTCSYFIFPFTGPSALTVNITKNIESSSIVVQWDAVDDFLPTSYIVTWTDERDLIDIDTVDEQTSYTITGLTLDTVYTITVTAANNCGDGPEFRTSILLSIGTTSTTSTISPTVTASTNPMTIISTANPSSSTTTTALSTTTANSMTTTVSRDTGYTTMTTSSLTAITTTSSLDASIADTTTTTTTNITTTIDKCFSIVTTTTTVITNNLCT